MSEFKFESVGSFSEGYANVRINDKWGYINKKFEIVIEPQFKSCNQFSEGLAAFMIESCNGDKWGFIDRQGKAVIEPKFDEVYYFNKGLARVNVGGRWGYINKAGDYVWKPSV